MESLIKMENICKKYEGRVILQDVNLSIEEGETVAFIGSNGTGKSTLLRVISGLSNISSGKIKTSRKLKFNYIPERFEKSNFTVSEFIKEMGNIEGLKKDYVKNRSMELYKNFLLLDMVNTPMKYLSKGTLQKVSVIQALLTKPDVLILDEPLSGQDTASQKKFIELMLELKKEKVTILMSCHEEFLVQKLADRVIKIENKGCTEVSNFNKEDSNKFVSLIFYVNEIFNLKDIKKEDGVCEVSIKENEIYIRALKGESRLLLLKLLQAGFVLKKYEEM